MTMLPGYRQFDGRSWDLGSVCNALAYRGVRAPHTDAPYSEALLLGISGGVMMGYFAFAYKGQDPHVALLSRNTFDPLDTVLARLGIVQHRRHARDAAGGLRHLLEALDEGQPAIVWADAFGLPYNGLPAEPDMWANFPILVYGHDESRDAVWIADRAAVPLQVTPADLARARARVKQDRFRVLTLDPPDPRKLAGAVRQGIADCLRRYVEAPVRNAKANFGLAAFEHWAGLLTTARHKQNWARMFPPGVALYAGLASAYDRFGLGVVAAERDRLLYAAFLGEAAVLVKRPALAEAAEAFQRCAPLWRTVGETLLPDAVRSLRDTRRLRDRRRALFVERGGRARGQIMRIDARLAVIRERMRVAFPLDSAQSRDLCAQVADRVLAVGRAERFAYERLRAAMSGRA